ncbi:uncharacterized protein LOC107176741 [Citrus sinensis]|uniref:uncharacterized protein LOC107176741 n=1 Tax=Citrus sinensis TaxID=2711 RepID=UPI00076381DD|nr:uncharacterized protein LOC107176741 [Citrus sinensis]
MDGYQYTWERSRGTVDWVEERLDRALASSAWISLFPKARVLSLEAMCSDHLPIFLDPFPQTHYPRLKRFRFEKVWLREQDCVEVVTKSWELTAWLSIQSKLSFCGSELMRWGSHLACDFIKWLAPCKQKMGSLRGCRDQTSLAEFVETRKRYNELLHNHEVFWKQRSKSLWLKEGDMNSRYFHSIAFTRNERI